MTTPTRQVQYKCLTERMMHQQTETETNRNSENMQTSRMINKEKLSKNKETTGRMM